MTTITYYISNSERQAWNRSRRKWWLSWHRQLEPIAQNLMSSLATGSRVHRALARWYALDRDPDLNLVRVMQEIIDEDRAQLVQRGHQLGLDELSVAAQLTEFSKYTEVERIMVEGYVKWLEEEGEDSQLEVISSETPLLAHVGTIEVNDLTVEVYAVGILDARTLSRVDGRRWFIDHKTVGSITAPQPTLHQNEQMLHYLLIELAQAGEIVTAGALYNMLRRVKRTTNAKPPFYGRVPITHSVIEVESYRRRLLATVRDIIIAKQRLAAGESHLDVVYPTILGDRCSWDCDFYSVCPLFDDGSYPEAMLTSRYQHRDPMDRYREAGLQIASQQV